MFRDVEEEETSKPLQLRMADARLWKSLLGAISPLIEEASFDADAEGIRLRAMDPSHVAMVDFEWPKTVFDEYVCDEPAKLCVNISEMQKLLRRIGKESLEISLDAEAARIKMVFTGTGGLGDVRTEFPKSCEDVLGFEVKEASRASYDLSYLSEIVRGAGALSDVVTWNYSTDLPVRLDFELPRGGRLEYYLAPRIEAE